MLLKPCHDRGLASKHEMCRGVGHHTTAGTNRGCPLGIGGYEWVSVLFIRGRVHQVFRIQVFPPKLV